MFFLGYAQIVSDVSDALSDVSDVLEETGSKVSFINIKKLYQLWNLACSVVSFKYLDLKCQKTY